MDLRTALQRSVLSLPLLLALAALTTAPVQAQGGGRTEAVTPVTAGATCVAPSPGDTADITAATNAVRAAHGIAPVQESAVLSAVAAAHACDMARQGRLTHQGGGGPSRRLRAAGYRPAVTAENIGAGPFDLAAAMAAWAASAPHRANMLNPLVREVGVGQAVAADGRTRFWAAIYAAPR